MRTDTFGQEVIIPPAHSDSDDGHPGAAIANSETQSPRLTPSSSRRSFQFFQRSNSSRSLNSPSPPRPRGERRLSNLLHRRSRSNSQESSANIPEGLPQIEDEQSVDQQEREAQWEKRATVLVQQNPYFGQSFSSVPQSEGDLTLSVGGQGKLRSSSQGPALDQQDDVSWNMEKRTTEEAAKVLTIAR